MARIPGGVATSHSRTIWFGLDLEKWRDPVWAPIFAAPEDFLKTRNEPGAPYSVAAKPKAE